MSDQIFEMHVDERGNPHVQVSQKFTVLTQEQTQKVIEKFNQLKAENVELRELCVTAKARYETVESVLERTRVENAKLRELAKAVREFIEDIHCDDCPMAHDCEENNIVACHEKLSYHAFCSIRELGMEVKE